MNKEEDITSYEITQQRVRLMKQKEFLTDILSKVEKQILALQVERLHLRNTLLGTTTESSSSREVLPNPPEKNNTQLKSIIDNPTCLTEKLDLSVPPLQHDFEEEIEDDDQSIS